MKCTICNTHFRSENREDVCPNCMLELTAVEPGQQPEPTPTPTLEPETEPTPEQEVVAFPYLVKIKAETLYCHKAPGVGNLVIGLVAKDQVHSIQAESFGLGSSKWGQIRDGAGWIALDSCEKVDVK